jgi:cytohesin
VTEAARSLHQAAEDGDLVEAERLLGANPYLVAAREDYKLTPLHRAAMAGHAPLVQALLERSAEVDARDYGGGTALHAAAARGREAAAAVLLARRADVNAKDRDGRTPLYMAAGGGHAAVAALLLAKGADPNIQGDITGTALHQAAAGGHRAVVEALLAHGAWANARSGASHTPWTAWHAANKAGHGDIAALLADHGGQDKAASAIPIHRAAEFGYLGRVQVVLNEDLALIAKRDYLHKRTALHWAASEGHVRIAAFLLDQGADLEAADKLRRTPLDLAKAGAHGEMVDLLRGRGAKS